MESDAGQAAGPPAALEPRAYSPGACLRNWSASILSLFRPVDSLFRNNASFPMKNTDKPSSSPGTRVSHADSKLTPVIEVIRSMRFGSYPNWITLPGAVRSVSEMSSSPNPNCTSADRTRCAFSKAGRTRKSMSPEYRGNPCQETARAPTIRYSTHVFSSVRVQALDKLSQVAAHRHCFALFPEVQKKSRRGAAGHSRCRLN